MKILITGINGFIGGKLAQRCLLCNWDVYGVGLARQAVDPRVNHYWRRDLAQENVESLLEMIVPDVVVHCAGSADVGYSVRFPQEDFRRNVVATYNLLSALRKVEGKAKIILMSSAGVYGNPARLPIHEEDPCVPISPYALHKKIVEDIAAFYRRQYCLDIDVLRVFSAYGPGLQKQLFWDMYQKISRTGRLELFGTGRESRDYIYIDDLVDVIYRLAEGTGGDQFIYNVANGEENRIEDVARLFVNAMGLSEDIISFNQIVREGDPRNWKADIAGLRAMGYRPQVNIQEGIKRYVAWCKSLGRL